MKLLLVTLIYDKCNNESFGSQVRYIRIYFIDIHKIGFLGDCISLDFWVNWLVGNCGCEVGDRWVVIVARDISIYESGWVYRPLSKN